MQTDRRRKDRGVCLVGVKGWWERLWRAFIDWVCSTNGAALRALCRMCIKNLWSRQQVSVSFCLSVCLSAIVRMFRQPLGILWWNLIHHSRLLQAQTFQFHKFRNDSKGHPTTGHDGPEGEWMYRSILSLTSALDGVGGQRHDPATLPPSKTRYPLYRALGGPQGRCGRVRKISSPPIFDPRIIQPVASRYTDWAIPVQIW